MCFAGIWKSLQKIESNCGLEEKNYTIFKAKQIKKYCKEGTVFKKNPETKHNDW